MQATRRSAIWLRKSELWIRMGRRFVPSPAADSYWLAAISYQRGSSLLESSVRTLIKRLVQLDPVPLRIPDPGEPSVVIVLRLLDRHAVRLQLFKERSEVADAVVDDALAVLGGYGGF